MKSIIFLLFTTMSIEIVIAQYQPIDSASTVQFKIKNFGFNVSGSFKGLAGVIHFDPEKPTESTFNVSLDANSVNTGIDMRDDHLRNDSYFDVQHYPRIRMVSTRITNSNKKGIYFFFGNMTIKNQVKAISFPFIAEQFNGGYLFKGLLKINRRDFDVGGSSTISDELEVSLNVIAK